MSNYPAYAPVQFVLDGNVVTLDHFDPRRTLLQYLREDLRRCGTKEGCAEGDCGACTVVIGRPYAGRICFEARNACIQLLGPLSGCALYTVESLGTAQDLHPVQQAMVECHASQCGFCTPGFVMSLFALYKNRSSSDRKTVNDALSANLCRCTGYVPIVAAAERMTQLSTSKDWLRRAGQTLKPVAKERRLVAKLESLRAQGSVAVEYYDRLYFAPKQLNELTDLYAQYPNACLLSGGTDIGLWVTKQHWWSEVLIYTGDVAELQQINVTDGEITIGAAVTLSSAMTVLVDEFPELKELLRRFASPPIRNAATLVGNIANGSPIGDSMPALITLGATLVLRREDQRRTVALEDFYLGYRSNCLQPSEIIEAVTIPRASLGDASASPVIFRVSKVSRRFDQDIAIVCGALRLICDKDQRVRSARVAFGGMAATPKRARHCEHALENAVFDIPSVTQAVAALSEDFTPISDMRADHHYRMRIAQNLFHRWRFETLPEPPATRVYCG